MKTESPSLSRSRASSADHLHRKGALVLSIFSEIKKDHLIFRKAMRRIGYLYLSAPERAKTEYAEFRVKLHAHARAEEETLYAYLLGKTRPGERLDDEVREGKEEHHLADLLLNELSQIPAIDPKWKAKFRVLQESVEHHLNEEEGYFRYWRTKLSRAEDQTILTHFLSRRSAFESPSSILPH
jgi:hypothetical protein